MQQNDLTPSLLLRRVNAARCVLDNCLAIGVRFEDVTVENLATRGGLLGLRGCMFVHVTMKGKAGSVLASPPLHGLDEEKLKPEIGPAMVQAYRSVDWALDISAAEFVDVSLDYVPGDLVRRDPETQFLLRRESLAELNNRPLPDGADIFFNRFDFSPFDSMVAVAPKRSRHFQRLLEILQGLRDAGLAE